MADTVSKWGVAATFVLSIIVNGLAATGALGGTSIGQVSDESPTYITPDGLTFSVWSIIYLLETVLVVAQLFPSQHAEELLSQRCPLTGLPTRQRIMLAFVSNATWLPVFVNLQFGLALVIILVYLGALLSVYRTLNTKTVDSFLEWLTLAAGVAFNASWVVVATLASVFTVGRELGWRDDFGVGGTPQAALAGVVVVAIVGVLLATLRQDLAWAGVAAWAAAGVYRMQTTVDPLKFPPAAQSAQLANGAWWSAVVVSAAIAVGAGQLALAGKRKPALEQIPDLE